MSEETNTATPETTNTTPPENLVLEESSTTEQSAPDSSLLDDADSEFVSTLPEEYRSEPSLKNVKNMDQLVKGYVHAQKEIGGRIRIPGTDATPEARAEFYTKLKDVPNLVPIPEESDIEYQSKMDSIYNKLGRPEKAEDYTITLDETLPVDEKFKEEVKAEAYKAGISQKQLDVLAKLENDRALSMRRVLEQQKVNVATHLKEKWGDSYDAHIEAAKQTLKKYADVYPSAVTDIRRGYASANPVIIEMLCELAVTNKEEITMGATDNTKPNDLTPESIGEKIRAIRSDKGNAYNNASNPDHEKAIAEVDALYRLADQKK